MYRLGDENQPVSKKLLELADRSEAQYEIVGKIVDIGEDHDGIFLQVQWLGLPDAIDRTWLPLKSMNEDMPEAVLEFLNQHKQNKKLVKMAKQNRHYFFLNFLHNVRQLKGRVDNDTLYLTSH